MARRSRSGRRTLAALILDVRSFADLAPSARVEALNRVFEGYVLPFKMSAEQFALHVASNSVVLEASPVFVENGEIAAAALVGIRGSRSWIGGFGVALAQRKRGLGRRLLERTMDAARDWGAGSMQLEVLENNPAAIALYEAGGFARTRRLLSFRTALHEREGADVREVPVSELLAVARQAEPPCWQRDPASLLQQPELYGFVRDGAGAAVRRAGTLGQLSFAGAGSAETFYALVEGLAARCAIEQLVLFNEPEGSPVCGWAEKAGWPMPFAQYEMHAGLR